MKGIIKLSVLLLAIFFASDCVCQTIELNKTKARLYIEECVNKRKLNLVDEIFADSFKVHMLLDSSQSYSTPTALKEFLKTLFEAFPDIQYTVGDILAENDKVVMRVSFSGSHKKEFVGIKPNGGKVDYLSEIFFFRFESGKIVEDWVQFDLFNLFKKLKGE